MKHELDTARRTILLDANDGVDRAAEPRDDLANGGVRALPQARRDVGVMSVKDDLHVLLDTANDTTNGDTNAILTTSGAKDV